MPVVVNHQNAFNRSPHSKVFIVILQALKARLDRRVLLRLGFLRAGTAWRKTTTEGGRPANRT